MLIVFESNDEIKFVMVFNSDLKMSKGKIAAQAGHCVQHMMMTFEIKSYAASKIPSHPQINELRKSLDCHEKWVEGSHVKVALKASENELFTLIDQLQYGNNVFWDKVHDEGRTQVESGSLTCIGIGPAPSSIIDQYTGGLKLL